MIFKNLEPIALLISISLLITVLLYILLKENARVTIYKFLQQYSSVSKFTKLPTRAFVYSKYILYLVVSILLSLSLFNPSFESREDPQTISLSGVDILFIVDLSLSMNATDIAPTRLIRFKEELLKLLPNLEGNRLGIIVFAGTPFLYCPMTSDTSAFSEYVRGLDVDVIPDTGTDLVSAFDKAKTVLDSKKVYRNRVVVLVTDGENFEKSLPSKLPADLLIWGLGTTRGGLIYYEDPNTGISGYLSKNGMLVNSTNAPDLVVSKLDETYLKKLADSQRATYINLSKGNFATDALLKTVTSMQKNSNQNLQNLIKKDGYQYFLYPALFLLLIDILVLDVILYKKLTLSSTL